MLRTTGLVLLLVGCSAEGPGAGDHPGDGPVAPTIPSPTVTGCDLAFTEAPALVASADPLLPLSRALEATLSRPAALRIQATDADGELVVWSSPLSSEHDLPLVGLHADGAWTLTVEADDGAGCVVEADPIPFTSAALPARLPRIDVLVAEPERMAPGSTLVPLTADGVSYLALLDAQGRIGWLYGPTSEPFTQVAQLSNGDVLALTDHALLEIDWMEVVNSWTTQDAQEAGFPVDASGFHGDALWSSRETIVALTQGTVDFPAYPLSYSDPTLLAPASVAQDVVVELGRDGTLLRSWDLTRLLDPGRIGYDSLDLGPQGYEWSRADSIAEDPPHDRWIVTARNQDAVFALGQTSRRLEWILATPENWAQPWSDLLLTPTGHPFQWPWHPHSAKFDPSGAHVLMFDNGNAEASPWTGVAPLAPAQSVSRVVQYTIDEQARTVAQDWEFRLDPAVFVSEAGDADWLANGNVLADFAWVEYVGGVASEDLDRGHGSVRLVELDPVTGRRVWDLDLWSPLDEEPGGWKANRAQRVLVPHAESAGSAAD